MLTSHLSFTEKSSGEIQQKTQERSHAVLMEALQILAQKKYRFTTVTPLTHERFMAQRAEPAQSLQDIFGWNLPFSPNNLPPQLLSCLLQANLIEQTGEYCKSIVRISSLGDDLFLHSAFPTSAADAVFFGPDTYRFARFIHQTLRYTDTLARDDIARPLRVLDIGCGTGAGGASVARSLATQKIDLVLNDINVVAIDFARANMEAAGIYASFLPGDAFSIRHGMFDLIVSNPPYMKDSAGRAYRNGGDRMGLDFSMRLVQYALNHLAPGGRLLLYTGVAMTGNSDPFINELVPLLSAGKFQWSYEEIDPDIFSEELEQPAYAGAHRIAAVGLVLTRPQ